jgi:hypothetical protein
MSIAAVSDLEIAPAPARPLLTPLMLAAACVALADWLLWNSKIGISLALFLGVLGVVAVVSNGVRVTRHTLIGMAVVLIAALLTLVEDVNVLSVLVGTLATAMFVTIVTAREASSWQRDLVEAATMPLRGPFQLAGDLFGALQRMKEQSSGWSNAGSLLAWITPLAAFAIFLGLFAAANPVIEYRLIDLRNLVHLDPPRVVFWILVVCVTWSAIHRRIRRMPALRSGPFPIFSAEPSDLDYLFGLHAMSRSLILFNALFALQSGLDLVYLWGGASLPNGMSHAEYAHRGAYPLIATALLAAGFVLIAMRPGGPAEQSRLIRPLVLVWVGQNILLVISSIFRLDLYVAAFSLTYLRLAAFIWMGLVAAGLILILIQIILRKPNSWLVTANAATLALVLYGCCFINTPWLVTTYNVEHCREAGGTGPNLDLKYLASLGPHALLALEAHRREIPALLIDMDIRFPLGRDSFARSENWRAWSFRSWRLKRYLANNPETSSNPSDSGKG